MALSCCSSKGDDNPMEGKRFDFVVDEYPYCCNVFGHVLGWDKA